MGVRVGRDRADCSGGHRRWGSHKGIKGIRGRDGTIAIAWKRGLDRVVSRRAHVRKAKVRIEAGAAVVGTMVFWDRIEILGQNIQAARRHIGKAFIHLDGVIRNNSKGR
jgi:hypothetical protein